MQSMKQILTISNIGLHDRDCWKFRSKILSLKSFKITFQILPLSMKSNTVTIKQFKEITTDHNMNT